LDISPSRTLDPVSVRWLEEAGIHAVAELEKVGAIEAYRRIKVLHAKEANLTMLWALVGGLTGTHWLEVPPEVKDALKRQLNEDKYPKAEGRRRLSKHP